eukprot:Skav223994  [mRNA]  locus=scaffold1943:122578:125868:- [translate_table: standard]
MTLAEWRYAIARTKTNTARGACGFSRPELGAMHDDLLSLLIDIFNSMGNSPFPEWFMLSRVVLVPKQPDAKHFADMRPITVCSLLFRLWAKVVARRLLLTWKRQIPSSVVGAMPGRSGSQLSLSTSLSIENALTVGTEMGGFNLDITKCFNTFGRVPLGFFMQRHGMPEHFAVQWIGSLNNMGRTVEILQSYSCPVHSTTGFAEGDPLSVCCMILVGYGWSALLSPTGVATQVFADDWGWQGNSIHQHIQAMLLTAEYLQSLKLASQPHKCWCWGTSKKARQAWLQINQAVTGDPRYYRIATSERELGVVVHYSKLTNHGSMRNRLLEGGERLKRLSRLPATLKQKALLIQTNVWPSALFGTDITYVGMRHFDTLRSLATSALTTKSMNTCTWLALSALVDEVCDPLMFAIARALFFWKRLLITDSANTEFFSHILGNAGDDPNKAFGPASALRCYLQQIRWSVSMTGEIHDHLGQPLHLKTVTNHDLWDRLWAAWDIKVTDIIRQRHNFQNWPEIDLRKTRRVALPDDHRDAATMVLLRTLGSIFAIHKEKWVHTETGACETCPLCAAEDTQEHFPLQCQGTAELRDIHSVALRDVVHGSPHMIFLPLIYKHPQSQLLMTLNNERDYPEPFRLSDIGFQGNWQPVLYTDGSATFPTLVGNSVTAYSVVIDMLQPGTEQAMMAAAYRNTGRIPDTLKPIVIAKIPGPQTINRVEFGAILHVIRSLETAHIFSDSNWAIQIFEEVRCDSDFASYFGRENCDMIFQLCELAQHRNLSKFRITKIKSHLDDMEVSSNSELYHIFGNRLADKLANRGTLPETSEFNKCATSVAKWYLQQHKFLLSLQGFLSSAFQRRLDAVDAARRKKPLVTQTESTIFDKLANWSPEAVHGDYGIAFPDRILSAFTPGAGLLLTFRDWAAGLQWPLVPETEFGISHYELICHFVGTTGSQMPRIVCKGEKYLQYRDPLYFPDAELLPATPWDFVRILESVITFTKRFLGLNFFPVHIPRIHKAFLAPFGYKKVVAGLAARPVLPHTTDHLHAMLNLVEPSGLKLPMPYDISHRIQRRKHSLDSLDHSVRVRNLKSLDYEVRKHGRVILD